MKNGDAFRAFIEESIKTLADTRAISYYQQPLPSPEDEQLAGMVDRFMAAGPDQRETFQTALSQDQRSLFGVYGHRAATLAVRESSPAKLLSGLVGAVISNYSIPDKRRVEVGLAVYHHCARKLDLNTVDLFENAAEFAATDFSEELELFGRRSDVRLAKFGWREVKTPEGVRYTFNLG